MDKKPISESESMTDGVFYSAEIMDQTKHILKSRTLWFNLACAAFAVLVDHTDLLRNYLSDGSYLLVMMFISVGNIYLRMITTTGVRLKSTADQRKPDQSLTVLQTRQRLETIDETHPQHSARTDLDNAGPNASGLSGNTAATPDDNHSPAVTGSACSAGD